MQKNLIFVLLFGLGMMGCKHQKSENKKTRVHQEDSAAYDDTEVDVFGLQTDSLQVEQYKVKRNESLYLILEEFNFSPPEIYSITQQAEDFVDFRAFKPGQNYRVYASADSGAGISHLVWQPNPIDYVVFDWQQDSLEIYKAARPLTSQTVTASGQINSSLFELVDEINASPLLAYKLAEIFAWQVDFFSLRDGDRFNVLYKKRFIDGEFYGIGDVLAAEFIHRGDSFRAYYFSHGNLEGYFDEHGKSVQKELLKAPFKFSQRVSSHFSHSRFHPILKKRMPHYGVDYAAPHGTPVLAVGDGVVTEAQYRGANGNIVKISHNSTYRTAYLHLKDFAPGIYRGATVEQGQIIGYVGNTGRSTGTHLDYRLYRNNHPVNPLTVELPSSDSIPDSLMAEFEKVRNYLDYRLNSNDSGKNRNDLVPMHASAEK